MIDLGDYMKSHYATAIENTLYTALNFKFPDMKGLEIESDSENGINIKFESGATKEEVELFIEEIKNYDYRTSIRDTFRKVF